MRGLLQVLLVTSSSRPDHWIVPGGGVEPEEDPSTTAVREVVEEAGVLGKLGRCLGVFEVRVSSISFICYPSKAPWHVSYSEQLALIHFLVLVLSTVAD